VANQRRRALRARCENAAHSRDNCLTPGLPQHGRPQASPLPGAMAQHGRGVGRGSALDGVPIGQPVMGPGPGTLRRSSRPWRSNWV